MVGEFLHFLEDPYVKPTDRAALHDDVEVLVIGGGFAGLLIGAAPSRSGHRRHPHRGEGRRLRGSVVLEPLSGAAYLDADGRYLLPLLEESVTSQQKYPKRPEYPEAQPRASASITTCTATCRLPDEDHRAALGRKPRAGRSTEPRRWPHRAIRLPGYRSATPAELPACPASVCFKGHSFHTSRWDYDYTGGDSSTGGLERLKDKVVGVIGTGATAVQCRTSAQREAHLSVPAHAVVDRRARNRHRPRLGKVVRDGLATPPEPPENFSMLTSGGYAEEDLVMQMVGKLCAAAA